MVKRIVATSRIDCENLIGQYVDESHYDVLVEEDTDCYMPPNCDLQQRATCGGACDECIKGNDERRIAFKFRKNYFTKEEQDLAYIALREAATDSFNRGAAAGPRGDIEGHEWVTAYQFEVIDYFLNMDAARVIDDDGIEQIRARNPNRNKLDDRMRGEVWLTNEIKKTYPDSENWFDRWVDGLGNMSVEEIQKEVNRAVKEWIAGTSYAKKVSSGVAGYFDRYTRIPYGRATAYTEHNPEKFAMCYPFLRSLNRGFKDLLPWRWGNQKRAADKMDKRYLIDDTVFTTITVNKSFRTACHYDAGDLQEGLSNLLVLGDGEYTGGYLVFPEYRVAVNVRPGDLLLVNNHEIIHGNTEIKLNHEKAERISIVCYFREKMLELKSYEYENLRRQFIEERKNNPDHPLQRPLWNGISPGWFKSDEWKEFLKKHNHQDEDGLVDIHDDKRVTLESFFED